jgi:hypothetical protein
MNIYPVRLVPRAFPIFTTCFAMVIGVSVPSELVSAPGHEVSPGKVAKPYAIQRYSKLWTAPYFHQTSQAVFPATEPPTPTPAAVCNYVLDGIAEAGGRQYIYLREKSSGTLHELQLKQPVGNLEVTKISLGDQPAYHKISIRSGKDTFVLQFDLSAPPTVQAAPKAVRRSDSPLDSAAGQDVIADDERSALEARRRSLREADGRIDEAKPNASGQ